MLRKFMRSLTPTLLLLGLLAVTGCGPKQKRIVFLNNNDSPFWNAARAGIQEADQKLNLKDAGMTAVMEINDGTAEGQISKLRQFRTQADVVGVAISIIDPNNVAIVDEMKALQAKGIPVVCVDSDIDREKFRDARSYFVGTDNLLGGKVLGTVAKNLRPDGGEYVQFVGKTGAQNARDRMDGFTQAIGDKEKYPEKGRMADDTDKTKARDNVRDAIRNNPKLAMLVGIWSYNAPAIVDVVDEKNRKDLTVVTFDAEALAVAAAGEGKIHGMVVQNPFEMGYQSVRLLKAMIDKDNKTTAEMLPQKDDKGENRDFYNTGLRVVVPDGSKLTPEMFKEFGDKVQFTSFPEFKKWLAAKKLESS